jgi:hypothetical protein
MPKALRKMRVSALYKWDSKMGTISRELAVLDQASRLLAEAKSFEDIKAIHDKVEAIRTYAKAARLGLEAQNQAAELKLRAERKAGGFLRAIGLRGGNRKSKLPGATLKVRLDELGISRKQSMIWQTVASVSEKDFCEYLKTMNEQTQEVTSAGLLRLARKSNGQVGTVRLTSAGDIPAQSSCTAPHELLLELSNHCQLLGNVLRPVYEKNSEAALRPGERKVVGTLIREMSELIRQLRKIWPNTNH